MVTEEFIKNNKSFIISTFKNKDRKLTNEDLQDLFQDTLEKVTLYQDYYINDFDKSKSIPEPKRLHAWLKLVTVQVYDRYRRGSIQIDEIVKDYTKDDLLISYSDYFYTANKDEVDELINLLPNKQRNIVYLKLILGHSYNEISSKLRSNNNAVCAVFNRGLTNLKKLINSDNPEKEVLEEVKLLKPIGDKPFAGDWAWRYGESEFQRNGKQYVYTNEELVTFCTARNLNYNIKERKL